MSELTIHYGQLLGLTTDWEVGDVQLELAESRVTIDLAFVGKNVTCPDCQKECSRHDMAPERTWRHLDTMQFETLVRARTPRCKCPDCGVKTVQVPWAEKNSRFTLLFEAFAIEVLLACSNVSRAKSLLRINWETAHQIMQRAVERGMQRRSVEELEFVGIDEKSFRKGQSYVTIMTDLEGRRVLEVVETRTEAATDELWRKLPEKQRLSVKGVAIDMWTAFMNSTRKNAPNADIVHDKFHISKHLNEAVVKVRKEDHKQLLKETGESDLTGSRQMWLYNEENLDAKRAEDFAILKQLNLKTARAWSLKEQLRGMWTYSSETWASKYFDKWYQWASRSKLKPMVNVAKTVKDHLPEVLNYFKHFITNSTSEGFNSVIQSIKSSAKGFKKFPKLQDQNPSSTAASWI